MTSSAHDASYQQIQKKQEIFRSNPPVFVGSSNWLTQLAASSAIGKIVKTTHIPIPIDTSFYQSESREAARNKFGLQGTKRYLLFAAMNASDKRKGFAYLLEALQLLENEEPKPCLLVAGKADQTILDSLKYETKLLGNLNTEGMRSAYRAADFFVIPSLEDNLPNTVLESMASGTPVIGFKTGGIAEMIDDGLNGWLASAEDSRDLAAKLQLAMQTTDLDALRFEALKKMETIYHPHLISKTYTTLMERLIK